MCTALLAIHHDELAVTASPIYLIVRATFWSKLWQFNLLFLAAMSTLQTRHDTNVRVRAGLAEQLAVSQNMYVFQK